MGSFWFFSKRIWKCYLEELVELNKIAESKKAYLKSSEMVPGGKKSIKAILWLKQQMKSWAMVPLETISDAYALLGLFWN